MKGKRGKRKSDHACAQEYSTDFNGKKKHYVNHHSAGWAVSILLNAEELGQDRLQKHLNCSHAYIATKQNFTASCGARKRVHTHTT